MNVRARDMPRFVREHRWARRHMSQYIDGELPGAGAERVEDHVSRCPQCGRLLSGLNRTIAALRGLERPPHEDGDLAGRVIARLREQR